MLRKLNLFIFFISAFILSSQSQEKIKEYEPPKVIEGSNLLLYSNPDMRITNSVDADQQPRVSYNIDITANYTHWRLTDRLDYTCKAALTTYLSRYPVPIFEKSQNYNSFYLSMRGGLSYYLLKDKFFIGSYANVSQRVSNQYTPNTEASLFPNIGFGKITDAMVVNEASNFEKVLLKENYINKPFDKITRQIVNNLLDKRNGNDYYSKYKEDADVVFFSELEKYLLEEKIISKPLNARAVVKLIQTLQNNAFILFPLYKGYQLQAEYNYTYSNSKDTLVLPQTITINGAYGLPIGSRTSLLFSSHFIFPVNNDYNIDFRQFNMHSPIFLKSEFLIGNNYSLINSGFINLDYKLYDFKASANVYLFHYLNPTAGIIGSIEYTTGKRKNSLNDKLDNEINADAQLIFNILNKMRLSSGAHFSHYHDGSYYFTFRSGISYYIF